MKVLQLTDNRIAALKALARFQYLTLDQFLRLKVATTRSNLSNRVLIPLRETKPALIQCGKRGAMKADVYCLTKRGVAVAAEEMNLNPETIPFPTDGIQFERDFEHRVGTVDFMIALWRWVKTSNAKFDFAHTYFQGTGAQRGKLKFRRLTSVELANGSTIVPDVTFRIKMADQQHRLFVFEYHRGEDSGRIIDQLTLHTKALQEGVFSQHYDHPFANYLLSVYERPQTMDCTMKRLRDDPKFQAFSPCCLFATLKDLKQKSFQGWIMLDGTVRQFFC